ncbi:type II secretion system F family protein [Clostridium pasteurianum]|uniref:Type II secretory pathway, component PulF n=1 Tax=Clostridium pasteurianum BC1 TaxID=86416 RepID=R4KF25_CLOPA|nr:type II secretion system F family protein [Clostridium pasteurianum]AGK98210.1 type II secretory pathway, component PulF [Clostridium pasteurianum BC1]
MPTFQYEAKTTKGNIIKGKIDAVGEEAIIEILRRKDYYPIKIAEYKEGFNVNLSEYQKVPMKDIAIFARQFAVVLEAGITILRAIEILKEQSENKKLKRILSEVFEEVQKGNSLSESMGKYKDFPKMFISMISVGEASGTLDSIMNRMAGYYDKEYRLRQKIKSAVTYPIIVSVFAFLVVVMLVTFVLPKFVVMLDSLGAKELPLPTRIVMGSSSIIQHYYILIILIVIAIIIIANSLLKTKKGTIALDTFKMKVPMFGSIYQKIVTARFARTFGILVTSGLSVLESIDISKEVVGNVVIKNVLDLLEEDIKKGESLGESLKTSNVFPLMLSQMIKIGEDSGTLDYVLDKTAEFYDGEVDSATAQIAVMVEPLIIIVLAAVVGFIIISVILPIFDIYNAMG